jgi:predicted SprT family Zn-dependent metalloprotease
MTPKEKKLQQIKDTLNRKATLLCGQMGCRAQPYIEFSTRVDTNSGQVYPDGKIVLNDEYILLNYRKPKVMHNLIAHECAHLADPDPSGTQHDESFMSVYKRYGWGIKDDPLYLGNESLTTPHYALICKKCGNIWFYQGKPSTTKYCNDDGRRLSRVDVYKNKYLNTNWRKLHARNNKATKKELEKIFKI